MKLTKKHLLVLVAMMLVAAGCADVAACITNQEYGFWNGLWHGFVSPISFFGSLIFDKVAMYAVNNNGHWYDFGYWLGMGSLISGRWITIKL